MTIGLAVAGIIIAGLAVAFFSWPDPRGKRIRLGAVRLYYSPALTADVVDRVVEYLKRQQYTDRPMDARLLHQDETYQFQIIFSGPPHEDRVTGFEVLAAGLSDDVFAGGAVEVHVCDRFFRPYVVIPHRGRYGRRITMNAAHLFYLEGVTDQEALSVATFLVGAGLFNDSPKIAQMNRGVEGYEFRLAVKVDPQTPERVEGARRMAGDLSRVLGASVAVHFCQGPLAKTLRAVDPLDAEHGREQSHVPGGPYRAELFYGPTGPLLAAVERKKNGIAKMTEPEPSAEADVKGENRQGARGG
jgi:hypothetical protein